MTAERHRPSVPVCPGCDGRKFRQLEPTSNGVVYFECATCGREQHGHRITTTVRRIAQCEACKESFLWNWQPPVDGSRFEREVPKYCRACECYAQGVHYQNLARGRFEKSNEIRVSQRRAVARFKLPESAADQQDQQKVTR